MRLYYSLFLGKFPCTRTGVRGIITKIQLSRVKRAEVEATVRGRASGETLYESTDGETHAEARWGNSQVKGQRIKCRPINKRALLCYFRNPFIQNGFFYGKKQTDSELEGTT